MADNPKQPQPQPIVRKPGSQVAPGQKPLFRPGATASTHSRIPLDQATAGKLFRVRDKVDAQGSAIIWGEDLSHAEAQKLKEAVVGSRRSKTARIEEMPVIVDSTSSSSVGLPDGGTIALGDTESRGPAPGEGDGMGDDAHKWSVAFLAAATARGIRLSREDETFVAEWFTRAIHSRPPAAIPTDPVLAEVRQKALAKVAPIARQAQVRHDTAKRQAVVSAPPTPPPSPLTDDLVDGDAGGELPPEDFGAADISDISAEIGGGPSDADKSRAKAQADADVAEMIASAMGAYQAEVQAASLGADQYAGQRGPWPTWEQLGEFEHAAWRYYVSQGGPKPELTKTPRKVGHAMGNAS